MVHGTSLSGGLAEVQLVLGPSIGEKLPHEIILAFEGGKQVPYGSSVVSKGPP